MSSGGIYPLPILEDSLLGVPTPCLYSGCRFKGEKRWKNGRGDLEVELQNVDRTNDVLYGVMTMILNKNAYATKYTYFEGEIIGKKNSFITRKWFADSETDKKHWWKFDYFYKYAKVFSTDQFDYGCMKGNDQIYMRWKETRSKDNVGVVCPGFYYVCLTKSTGTVEGIYYERNCDEWNADTFSLKNIRDKGVPVYQFR